PSFRLTALCDETMPRARVSAPRALVKAEDRPPFVCRAVRQPECYFGNICLTNSYPILAAGNEQEQTFEGRRRRRLPLAAAVSVRTEELRRRHRHTAC